MSTIVMGDTQSISTPDPGTCEGPVKCGVCGEETIVTRDCYGPRGFAMAMSGSKIKYDLFACPHREEQWHKQAVAIREEAKRTSSAILEAILLEEADLIVYNRQATK